MKNKQIIGVLLFLQLINLIIVNAQVSSNDKLYKEIIKSDSILFEEGFNNCNLDALYQITDSSFEFYHDQSGTTYGQDNFVEGIRKNICSLKYKPQRRLVKGSSEIYPLKSNVEIYGAVQFGKHEFYAIEKDKEPYLTSTAKFTHLWIKKDNRWILKRVLSYDHKEPNEPIVSNQFRLFENQENIETWLKKNNVPALGVALIKNYQLTGITVYGDLYEQVKAPYNTIFNVASLTKPIVTMLTLKLVDNGDWKLDEPLYKYWTDPDVKDDPNSKKITTRHILSHQTGFPNWRRSSDSKKLEFNFEPGSDFRYSGEGFEYLRRALENKFNTPLEELADSLIFRPLGMNDTWFYWNESVNEERFAKWHDSKGNLYKTKKNKSANAADDLLTTIEDYGKFAEFVINGGDISNSLYNQMITQQNGKDQKTVMGLGWEILPDLKGDEFAILHTGGDKGVNTLIILLPKTGEGIVIFTNGDKGKNLYFQILKEELSLGKQIVGEAQ